MDSIVHFFIGMLGYMLIHYGVIFAKKKIKYLKNKREAAEKEPEYISPEKEYLSSEQIDELRQMYKSLNAISGAITAEQFAENARIFASGGTASVNIVDSSIDPPETVVPVSVVSRLVSIPENKGHLLKWFDTDMGRVFEGIGNLGTFEVKQFNDAGEFIGIKVSQKFKYPAAYEKGYGGFIYPYEYIPPYLEVSKHYAAQFAGKTIADAAELVGNYGQPMTFKK